MIVFTQEEIAELKRQVNEHGEGYLHYANALIERLFERKYGWDAIDYDEITVYAPQAPAKAYGLFRPFKIEDNQFDPERHLTMCFDIFSHHEEIARKHIGVKYYISLFGRVGYFVVCFDSLEELKDFAHWRELEVDYWRIDKGHVAGASGNHCRSI